MNSQRLAQSLIVTASMLAACVATVRAQSFPTPEEKEAIALALAAPAAKREGKHLKLHLTSGKIKTYDDRPCGDPSDCLVYRLERYLRAANLFVVQVAYYEGHDFKIVDGASGRETFLDGRPNFSPTGERAIEFLFGPDRYDQGGPAIRIWRRSGKSFRLEWSRPSEPETTYVVIDWSAPDRIDLRSVTNGSFYALEATKYFSLRRRGKAWRTLQEAHLNQVEEEVALCLAKVDEERPLHGIVRKFNRRTPTFYQLNDPEFATKAEAAAFRLWTEKGKACAARRRAIIDDRFPALEPSYALLHYQEDQVFEYLTKGLITWGDANRLARDALSSFHARGGAYFAGVVDRRKLTQEWRERLQRARPSRPPDGPRMIGCIWANDGIACD